MLSQSLLQPRLPTLLQESRLLSRRLRLGISPFSLKSVGWRNINGRVERYEANEARRQWTSRELLFLTYVSY